MDFSELMRLLLYTKRFDALDTHPEFAVEKIYDPNNLPKTVQRLQDSEKKYKVLIIKKMESIYDFSYPSGICQCGLSLVDHLNPLQADHSYVDNNYSLLSGIDWVILDLISYDVRDFCRVDAVKSIGSACEQEGVPLLLNSLPTTFVCHQEDIEFQKTIEDNFYLKDSRDFDELVGHRWLRIDAPLTENYDFGLLPSYFPGGLWPEEKG